MLFDGKRTPEKWCKVFGVRIITRSGWQAPNALDWGAEISRAEFRRRMGVSLVEVVDYRRWVDNA